MESDHSYSSYKQVIREIQKNKEAHGHETSKSVAVTITYLITYNPLGDEDKGAIG